MTSSKDHTDVSATKTSLNQPWRLLPSDDQQHFDDRMRREEEEML
jgi:hypothetical protein